VDFLDHIYKVSELFIHGCLPVSLREWQYICVDKLGFICLLFWYSFL
jgi:hypothetical protein